MMGFFKKENELMSMQEILENNNSLFEIFSNVLSIEKLNMISKNYSDFEDIDDKLYYQGNLFDEGYVSFEEEFQGEKFICFTKFLKGVQDGYRLTFDLDHQLKNISRYKNGLANGIYFVFHDKIVIEACIAKNGYPNGFAFSNNNGQNRTILIENGSQVNYKLNNKIKGKFQNFSIEFKKQYLEILEHLSELEVNFENKKNGSGPILDIKSYYEKGFEEFKNKNYEKSILFFDKHIEDNSNHELSFYYRGISKHELGFYSQAILDYNKILNLDKVSSEITRAYYNRGVSYQSMGNYSEAIKDYKKAIIKHPKHKFANNNIGVCLLEIDSLNNKSESVKYFDKAIQLDSTYVDALHNRGLAFSMINEMPAHVGIERIFEIINKLFELNPQDLTTNNLAIKDFSSAIEIDPNYSKSYYQRALLYFVSKEFNNSISDSSKAIELGFNLPQSYFYRSIAKFFKGNNLNEAKEDAMKSKNLGLKIDDYIQKIEIELS